MGAERLIERCGSRDRKDCPDETSSQDFNRQTQGITFEEVSEDFVILRAD